ncbi:hypothetical protein SAY86_021287 [Trapa natans]|uniref:Response regulatory domain-containing protein n=1 Tax=Trapa natans TaxID=22666 RepID=A0AAN7MS57_TRANT|nr:hypothetical protein SAY86_021287 [Trapa natans]
MPNQEVYFHHVDFSLCEDQNQNEYIVTVFLNLPCQWMHTFAWLMIMYVSEMCYLVLMEKDHNGRFQLDLKPFDLHALIREAASLSKCLCIYKGLGFSMEVDRSLPNIVLGDERRVFQVILHMVGNLLSSANGDGLVTLRIFLESRTHGSGEADDHHLRWATRISNSSDGNAYIRFEVGITGGVSHLVGLASRVQLGGGRYNSDGFEGRLSFSICKRLVQLMRGNIWVVPNPQGLAQSMTLLLQFQHRLSSTFKPSNTWEYIADMYSDLRGIKILLAETDDLNRVVTRKLLEKLGCRVSTVGRSDLKCLSAIAVAGGSGSGTQFDIILLDVNMPEMESFKVAARMKRSGSRNCPLIVALTTSGEEDLWERCSKAGMDGVIRKPVSLEGMSCELQRVLHENTDIVALL